MTMTIDENRFDSDDDSSDLAEAAHQAELARASFSASVRTASASSVHAMQRVAARARPIVIAALVVGGAAVLVAAVRLVRRPRRFEWMAPPRKRGLFGSVVRTAAMRLLVLGAAHVVQKFSTPHVEEPSPLPAAGVPR